METKFDNLVLIQNSPHPAQMSCKNLIPCLAWPGAGGKGISREGAPGPCPLGLTPRCPTPPPSPIPSPHTFPGGYHPRPLDPPRPHPAPPPSPIPSTLSACRAESKDLLRPNCCNRSRYCCARCGLRGSDILIRVSQSWKRKHGGAGVGWGGVGWGGVGWGGVVGWGCVVWWGCVG